MGARGGGIEMKHNFVLIGLSLLKSGLIKTFGLEKSDHYLMHVHFYLVKTRSILHSLESHSYSRPTDSEPN